MIFRPRQAPQVGLDHFGDHGLQRHARLPAQNPARARSVTLKDIHLRRPEQSLVDHDMVVTVEPGAAEGNVYHAGDTALFSDMSLIGAAGLKAAILPVGDNYTMGPEDSLAAIRLLQPQLAIPCHYSTFPVIEQDITLWAQQVRQNTSAAPLVMAPGSTVEL